MPSSNLVFKFLFIYWFAYTRHIANYYGHKKGHTNT